MGARKSTLVLLLLVISIPAVLAQGTGVQVVTVPSLAVTGENLQLPGILHKPSGDGPFPAVVLLVGCEGIAHPDTDPPDTKAQAEWFDRLVGWGYVALEVDSFSPRGHYSVCDNTGVVNADMRSHDAFAAKAYLSKLSFVDPKNIGVMGWSHGGWSLMRVIDAAFRDQSLSPFKVAVGFYPYCQPLVYPDTPLLVLIGRKDDWCPAALAESLGKEYKNWGWKPELALTVYPSSTHAFDVDWGKGGFTFGEHHMDYDEQATADAISRTKAFLAKYLQSK